MLTLFFFIIITVYLLFISSLISSFVYLFCCFYFIIIYFIIRVFLLIPNLLYIYIFFKPTTKNVILPYLFGRALYSVWILIYLVIHSFLYSCIRFILVFILFSSEFAQSFAKFENYGIYFWIAYELNASLNSWIKHAIKWGCVTAILFVEAFSIAYCVLFQHLVCSTK